ncbi:hypothetical protein Bbelb_319480 [Branchiostoma belcheri]|nr:hypothetical protein Bbelb_319480 [Branchiostoma belcheri]
MNQSTRGENNPVYLTNHPEEPTSSGPEEDVLYSDGTAEATRMSRCGQGTPNTQGTDMENDDGNAIGNIEEGPRVMQTDSTVTMNRSTKRNANKSLPGTTGDKVNSENRHEDFSIEVDMEPHAVENIGKEPQLQQADGDAGGDFEPYAVTDMFDNETYLS